MTSSMSFDERAARQIEAVYATPDVAATRAAVLGALEPRPGERIADLGCGPGYMARELALAVGPGGRVHALDLSEPMLELARRRCGNLPAVKLAAGDMTALALPDGSVDAAVALQSLAYVPDVARAIGEIAACCARAGERYCSTRTSPAWSGTAAISPASTASWRPTTPMSRTRGCRAGWAGWRRTQAS